MLFRTLSRLDAAKGVRDLREVELRHVLEQAGVTEPAAVDQALDTNPAVDDARDLVEARRQQFEDWLAFGIFLAFLSGADAFVSAHLQNFPEPVSVGLGGDPSRMELGVTLPLGGGR
jgi:hypothetical protein